MAKLDRTLGLWSLTIYGVGLILGAGIYSIIGAAAGAAGRSLWLSFVVAGLVALLTALSYAELATMFPKAGAEYTYVRMAAPKLVWARRMLGTILVFSSVVIASTVATAFASYAGAFVSWNPLLVAALLLALMAAVNVVGMKQSSWANIVMTAVEAAGLVLIVLAGIVRPEFGQAVIEKFDFGILAGAGLVFFSFLGFEDIANVAEEAKDPARNLPRAILWCVGVSTVLYVLVALAVVALRSPNELAQSDRPLAFALAAQWPQLAGVLGGIALFATANTALIALVAASRMTFGMAREGDLPIVLAKLHPSRHSPWVAVVTVAAIAVCLLPLRDAASLGGLASFGALIAFATVNVCLVALRRSKPDIERPFRVPWSVKGVPVLPLAGVIGAIALAAALPQVAYLSGLAFLAVLGVVEIARARLVK